MILEVRALTADAKTKHKATCQKTRSCTPRATNPHARRGHKVQWVIEAHLPPKGVLMQIESDGAKGKKHGSTATHHGFGQPQLRNGCSTFARPGAFPPNA